MYETRKYLILSLNMAVWPKFKTNLEFPSSIRIGESISMFFIRSGDHQIEVWQGYGQQQKTVHRYLYVILHIFFICSYRKYFAIERYCLKPMEIEKY